MIKLFDLHFSIIFHVIIIASYLIHKKGTFIIKIIKTIYFYTVYKQLSFVQQLQQCRYYNYNLSYLGTYCRIRSDEHTNKSSVNIHTENKYSLNKVN